MEEPEKSLNSQQIGAIATIAWEQINREYQIAEKLFWLDNPKAKKLRELEKKARDADRECSKYRGENLGEINEALEEFLNNRHCKLPEQEILEAEATILDATPELNSSSRRSIDSIISILVQKYTNMPPNLDL
jgi:hypothetical protein